MSEGSGLIRSVSAPTVPGFADGWDRPGVAYIDYLPDNAEEARAELPAMTSPCVACPYTPGTEASQHPVTARIAAECVEARCAFFCHLTKADPFDCATHLCAGWVAGLANVTAQPGTTVREEPASEPKNLSGRGRT